jgi:hypothetical protein
VLCLGDTSLMRSIDSRLINSSLERRNASEGEYMRKRAPSCSTFAISRYGPCKHAYCLAHLVLLKEKQLQKPFITVSPAVLQCCSILPMRLQSPDWSRKSIEEVCYLCRNAVSKMSILLLQLTSCSLVVSLHRLDSGDTIGQLIGGRHNSVMSGWERFPIVIYMGNCFYLLNRVMFNK